MTTLDTKYDSTKGNVDRFDCGNCGAPTYHEVMASVDVTIGILSGVGFKHYQVVQCRGCQYISFRVVTKMPELGGDLSPTRKTKKINVSQELYPTRKTKRRPLDDALDLPKAVQTIYWETFKAIDNQQPVLTGIGIRAILETVCKERSAKKGANLQQQIDHLVVLGLLSRENADFLHGLRILGNKAAHEVIPHSKENLEIAMEVIEHLLKTVYLLPAKARKLLKP